LDQHGGEGPTALVETDGSLHIIGVLRFGPDIVELADQQRVWDQVIGRLAPAMKPFVNASELDEEGVEPHPKLQRDGDNRGGSPHRVDSGRGGRRGSRSGRAGTGSSSRRSRGDR
jgi:hypothetical protein